MGRSPQDSEKENVMLKRITASIAFAALLVGAASTLAARTHTQTTLPSIKRICVYGIPLLSGHQI